MKLVIRHHALRRLAAQVPAWFASPRAAALRLRRPPKQPVTASSRNSIHQDARTFIESRTERHLHFSQNFHLHLSAPVSRALTITPRVAEARRVSATLSALRQWRTARGLLTPENPARSHQDIAGQKPAHRRSIDVPDSVAHPTLALRVPRSRISVERGQHRAIHPGHVEPAASSTSRRSDAPRVMARAQRAARTAELIAAEDRVRERALQPRARVTLRNRAAASLEARTRQLAPFVATPAPVTLTYRRAPGDTAPREHAMDLMQLANSPLAARRVPAAAASASDAPSNYRAATNSPPRIDPAMLEGFADDIIRRIDKRARIERERRGI